MKKRRIYLDTSVFIAEFDKKDRGHNNVNEFFKDMNKIKDIELCTSKWSMAELKNRLTKKDKRKELKIFKYMNDLLDKGKIRTLKLKILKIYPREHYGFDDFFNDLSDDLIKYKTGKNRPGLGDIMHIRIMKNNKIKHIATLDSNFENIAGLVCINLFKVERYSNSQNKIQAN